MYSYRQDPYWNPYLDNHYHYPYTYPQYAPYTGEERIKTEQQPSMDKRVLEAIKGEAAAIDFYTRLLKVAPNQVAKTNIEHALADEKIHLKEFTKLYTELTGKKPEYRITPTQFSSYEEGLYTAYQQELEAYEEYRDAYLATKEWNIRDVFFLALTDEMEHASRFSFLYLLAQF